MLHWFHGKLHDSDLLFGLIPVFAVARAAKTLEYFSALTIVLDLVGKETLANWVDWLIKPIEFLSRIFDWVRKCLGPSKFKRDGCSTRILELGYRIAASSLVIASLVDWVTGGRTNLISVFISQGAMNYFVIPVTVVAIALSILSLLLPPCIIWLKKCAESLNKAEREDPKRPILCVALALLTFGFALDLLTS